MNEEKDKENVEEECEDRLMASQQAFLQNPNSQAFVYTDSIIKNKKNNLLTNQDEQQQEEMLQA